MARNEFEHHNLPIERTFAAYFTRPPLIQNKTVLTTFTIPKMIKHGSGGD